MAASSCWAAGWLLLRLVADDLRAHQEAQLSARATAVSRNANRYLHAREDDQPVIAEKSRRRLEGSARDIGIRLTGPDDTVSAGPQPAAGTVRERVVTVTLLAAPVAGAIAWAISARAVLPLRRLQRRTSGLDLRSSATRLEHTRTRITEVDDLAHTVQTVFARYDQQAVAPTRHSIRPWSSGDGGSPRTASQSADASVPVKAGARCAVCPYVRKSL